ncbi:hypothetical protein ACHAWX_001292 [Stephanocyclus meneghinianus]
MPPTCSGSTKDTKFAVDTTNVWSDAFSDDELNLEDFTTNLKLAEVSENPSFKDNFGIIDSFVLIKCKKIEMLSLEDYRNSQELCNHQEQIRDQARRTIDNMKTLLYRRY